MPDILHDPLQARKHRVSVAEGQLAEISFKHRSALVGPIDPVGIDHVDLVFIGMERQMFTSHGSLSSSPDM
ncbi:hypothetical protein D1872_294680 [compost metagenome]